MWSLLLTVDVLHLAPDKLHTHLLLEYGPGSQVTERLMTVYRLSKAPVRAGLEGESEGIEVRRLHKGAQHTGTRPESLLEALPKRF